LIKADGVKEMLFAGPEVYTRDLSRLGVLYRLLGKSLIGVTGADWVRHHRVVSRAFQPR
jgi:cytochrome P450